MAQIDVDEFWRELDATDENFVRQKYARRGYSPARSRIVNQWLEMKNSEHKATQDAQNLRASRTTAVWTMISAIVATIGLVITLVIAITSRTPI